MHRQCLLRSPRLHCRVYHFPSLQNLLHCYPFLGTNIVTRQADMKDFSLLILSHGQRSCLPYNAHKGGVPGVSA